MSEIIKISKFRDETRDLLNDRPASLSISAIAEATGVSEAWLNMFRRGEINNPGVVTVETINVFLKNYKK